MPIQLSTGHLYPLGNTPFFGYGQFNIKWVWGISGMDLDTPIPDPMAGLPAGQILFITHCDE
jgi:hypothetical protein